jgi:hypothetical protein
MSEESQKNINVIRQLLIGNGYHFSGSLNVSETKLLKFTNASGDTIGIMPQYQFGKPLIAVITKPDKFTNIEDNKTVIPDFVVGFDNKQPLRDQFVKMALAKGVQLPNEKLVEAPAKKKEIL